MYNFWKYGSRAGRKLIDFLEGDKSDLSHRTAPAVRSHLFVPPSVVHLAL